MKCITLVIGGQRSGKSRFAIEEARKYEGRKAFVATSERIDEEMAERIERHVRERGKEFETFEEPRWLPEVLERIGGAFEVILVDCLTVWVSNLLYYGIDLEQAFLRFKNAISSRKSHFIIVSNETGLGVIPEAPLARRFTDSLGNLNKIVAEVADRVVFMIAGIPINLKKGGRL